MYVCQSHAGRCIGHMQRVEVSHIPAGSPTCDRSNNIVIGWPGRGKQHSDPCQSFDLVSHPMHILQASRHTHTHNPPTTPYILRAKLSVAALFHTCRSPMGPSRPCHLLRPCPAGPLNHLATSVRYRHPACHGFAGGTMMSAGTRNCPLPCVWVQRDTAAWVGAVWTRLVFVASSTNASSSRTALYLTCYCNQALVLGSSRRRVSPRKDGITGSAFPARLPHCSTMPTQCRLKCKYRLKHRTA